MRLPFSYARLVCKPSSVLNGHLSRTYISARLKRCGELCGPLFMLPILHRVGFTSRIVAKLRVSSYLAFPSLPRRVRRGGLFLLHFSGGCPRLMLSVILPCDARTFLALLPFGVTARDRPARLRVKYTMFCGICQGAGSDFCGVTAPEKETILGY